ncbi:MAG: CopG family transcriptional regulator [Anaerosomatales bacterium]|nr:CopG family transcriptional regulator [Anaerosomatales bacterium]
MERMVRKQVVITQEQDRALASKAREMGVSQSALIREAIDALLAAQERRRLRTEAWRSVLEASERAAEDGVGSGGRRWTREDAHGRGAR